MMWCNVRSRGPLSLFYSVCFKLLCQNSVQIVMAYLRKLSFTNGIQLRTNNFRNGLRSHPISDGPTALIQTQLCTLHPHIFQRVVARHFAFGFLPSNSDLNSFALLNLILHRSHFFLRVRASVARFGRYLSVHT